MHTTTRVCTGTALLVLSGSCFALDFDIGSIGATLITDFSVGTAVRLEDQDPDIVGISNTTADGTPGRAYSTNGDDGNLNFEKGDLIAGAAKLTTELNAGSGDFGILVRGSYLFDAVLHNTDFFDEEDYGGTDPSVNGGVPRTETLDDLERRRSRLQDRLGNDADLLDAYVYGGFDINGQWLSFRLGRQVLNWGESTFIQNGLNSIISADASQLRVPGFDLTEVYVPVGMVWGAIALTDDISLEAFYQYDWERSVPDPAGSFFSTNDFATYGGETVEVGFGRCPEHSAPGTCAAAAGGSAGPRVSDRLPEQGGQGGISLGVFTDQLGGADIAMYAANYHSRLPLVSGSATPAGFEGIPSSTNYFIEYPEDIKLYGISINTNLPFGGLALQGEYSLKQDQPIQVEDVDVLLAALRVPVPVQVGPYLPSEYVQGYRRFDVSQVDMSVSKLSGPGLLGQDQTLWLFEAGAMQVHNMPSIDELRFEGPATYQPGDPVVAAIVGVPQQTDGYADDFSWGYRFAARLTYNNVFNLFNVEPSLLFGHDVEGTSPTPILNFVEKRKELSAGVSVTYLQSWVGRLAYTRYWGGEPFNLLSDRDNLAASVTVSF